MGKHRLLLSGADGFVGRTVAQLVRGAPGLGEVELAPLCDERGAQLDICDSAGIASAIARYRPTAVIHLAAVASPRLAVETPRLAWDVNLMGTFNVAASVRQHAPEAIMVFAGSADAYGSSFETNAGPLDEDALLAPISVYGATKAAADIMLGQMAEAGLRVARFRPFNHTGPGQSAHYAASAFAQQIVRIERGWQPPEIRVGNLSARRDFLDVRDVASAYLQAALTPRACSGPLNLATGHPMAIGDMLDLLLAQSTARPRIRIDPSRARAREIETMSGDPGRAARLLGWSATTPIERTLGDLLRYWRRMAAAAPDALRQEA